MLACYIATVCCRLLASQKMGTKNEKIHLLGAYTVDLFGFVCPLDTHQADVKSFNLMKGTFLKKNSSLLVLN